MNNVDYAKLAEQYASFLVAVGGVSITVLALVLSMNIASKGKRERTFLIAALIIGTVCCFIGAHMMTETTASLQYYAARITEPELRPTGQRLFLLASTNIFLAAFLVLFALMMLPNASAKTSAAYVTPISFIVFLLVTFGVVLWLCVASVSRMSAPGGPFDILIVDLSALIFWLIIHYLLRRKCLSEYRRSHLRKDLRKYLRKYLQGYLLILFLPIVLFTVTSLIYFGLTFNESGLVKDWDMRFFSFAVFFAYISLVTAGLETIVCKKFRARRKRKLEKKRQAASSSNKEDIHESPPSENNIS
jgi:uncharacterized membrane protein